MLNEVAVPEKALTEKIQSERGLSMRSGKDVERYLVENMGLDIGDLSELKVERIKKYAGLYRSQKARCLAGFVRQVKAK